MKNNMYFTAGIIAVVMAIVAVASFMTGVL